MVRLTSSLPRRLGALAAAIALAAGAIAVQPATGARSTTANATSGCNLNSYGNQIKHVIYIQFDNTHFRRDNPNVPSDLEQMPNLLNFIESNGTLLTNDHTVLISHTATGILSSLTGVYPNRFGQPVANSSRYFTPSGTSRTSVSFAYWTAPLYDPAGPPFPPAAQTDLTPEMIDENGQIAPAPWVPYTRAGCDVGQVAVANTVLENTGIDIPSFFGSGSPEAIQAASDSPGASATQTFADYVGIGVHCAQGTSSICNGQANAKSDLLPDEPGGYSGYSALMGAKYVDPLIFSGGTPVNLDGNTIADQNGHVGFPGFDGMEATNSLSWVAHMQEAGIPITYAYISDAHDAHGTSGNVHEAYGPGEAGYVAQLKAYDDAFGKFFTRLANDGINKSNTLFVFTVDEGDHFAGSSPSPSGCDGVTTPCTYSTIGEINADLRRMIRTEFGDTTAFSVHSDDAPNIFVNGNPGPTDPAVRNLERESAALHWLNPYTGLDQSGITVALADPVEEDILHMVTSDPNRTPTFTLFADPQWFFFATGGAACATQAACASVPVPSTQTFAWNHGDIQDEIASTWVGYVGPGIQNLGTAAPWTDHTDLRPTILSLVGLTDDYRHDGRVTWEILDGSAVPAVIAANQSQWTNLADVYKQIEASFGEFDMTSLDLSTKALASNSAKDKTYGLIESKLATIGAQRDALALQISQALDAAEFSGTTISNSQASSWIGKANGLLEKINELDASF
ncbi:MAG TPA: hypothetical protein VKR30_07000 [Candidatus Limnocylindrales bacterium]|nr:hypothetical protein [Candidatus Limnocylindrales bacterium]